MNGPPTLTERFSLLPIGRHIQEQEAAECVTRDAATVAGSVGAPRRKSDMPAARALAAIPNVAIANSVTLRIEQLPFRTL